MRPGGSTTHTTRSSPRRSPRRPRSRWRMPGSIRPSSAPTTSSRAQSQLRQAQKMEAVGHLAGGIAHDFNNLLTAILGNLSLLLNDLPDGHSGRDLAGAAEKAGLRAANLTSQLLGFSRRTMLRPQPANLNATVDEVVTILRRTIDPRIAVE